jgi:hypothetical protein
MWQLARTTLWWLGAFAAMLLGTLPEHTSPTGAMAALLAITLLVAVAATVAGSGMAPAPSCAPMVREHLEMSAVMSQCDPDAAGRPRPRAPGRHRIPVTG